MLQQDQIAEYRLHGLETDMLRGPAERVFDLADGFAICLRPTGPHLRRNSRADMLPEVVSTLLGKFASRFRIALNSRTILRPSR